MTGPPRGPFAFSDAEITAAFVAGMCLLFSAGVIGLGLVALLAR